MLLAIDIGNTNITIGMFDGEELRATWRISTSTVRMPDEYASLLHNLLDHHGLQMADVTKMALCSVTPPLTGVFEELPMVNQY